MGMFSRSKLRHIQSRATASVLQFGYVRQASMTPGLGMGLGIASGCSCAQGLGWDGLRSGWPTTSVRSPGLDLWVVFARPAPHR